jgi:prophage DNA circulation protein
MSRPPALSLLALTAALALAATGSRVAAQPASPSTTTADAAAVAEFAAVERFLSLSNEQLDELQKAIARIRAMTPAERTALLERITTFRRLPASDRDAIRAGSGWLNEQDRLDWPRLMRSLNDAQRAEIHAVLPNLPVNERARWKHERLEVWRRATPQ